MKNTPYDDVFRTLLNDCSSLIIPVINEAFGEHYTGKEKIVFSPNEHFLNQQDGAEEERITDSCFRILAQKPKKYHCECQSNDDDSMLVRFFEYDAQIALDDGEIKENVLTVEFPHSTVLFLRSSADTPDSMKTRINTPGGSVEYDIPVIKSQRYSIDEIFEKNLLFLIPFYIFSHESRFEKYERDTTMLQTLKSEYECIRGRLEKLAEQKTIDEYTKCAILDMANKVLEHIAAKHEKIREGVKSVMGGQVLEYEAKRIRNEAIEQGIEQGELMKSKKIFKKCLRRGDSKQEAMDLAEIDQSLADELYEEFKKEKSDSGVRPVRPAKGASPSRRKS